MTIFSINNHPVLHRMESFSLTHIGLRKSTNQDRVLCRSLDRDTMLFAVIDGLGGQAGGREAATTALEILCNASLVPPVDQATLNAIIHQINTAIIDRGGREPALENMGAAATLMVVEEKQALWVHVGDCRLYHLRHRQLTQVTADHNLAWELFARGEISREERRTHRFNRFLSQCLGEDEIEPDQGSLPLIPGDILLLCTDGIHDQLDDETIESIIAKQAALPVLGNHLLSAALQAGGRDNVGLILVRI